MKIIDLNENDLETLETMHSLLLKYKKIFYKKSNGLCHFFFYLELFAFIKKGLYRKILTLTNYITDNNKKELIGGYWFYKKDYNSRRKYLEDLIKYNKKNN